MPKGRSGNNSDSNWLDRSPAHLLHRAGQSADDIFSAQMKVSDLTPRQLAILVTVASNEGLSQTGLVERTGMDRATLADVVKRLQKKGLLERLRTKRDARTYAVSLTEEGQRLLRTVQPLAKKVDTEILAALPAGAGESFLSALQAISTIRK